MPPRGGGGDGGRHVGWVLAGSCVGRASGPERVPTGVSVVEGAKCRSEALAA